MRGLLPILILLMLASCNVREAMLSDSQDEDSLALRVAVLPVEDCLPVYYAQRMGLFDSCEVRVQLLDYNAQMDADTALLRRRAHVGYTCLPRINHYASLGDTLQPVCFTAGRHSLMSTRKKMKLLAGKMVAVERRAPAELWLDTAQARAGMDTVLIYRPQVNDVLLRTQMFLQGLFEGAMLPEPYATQTRLSGSHPLFTSPDSVALCCWATAPKASKPATAGKKQDRQRATVPCDSMACQRATVPCDSIAGPPSSSPLPRFLAAYRRAADDISQGKAQPDTLRAILRQRYQLPDSVIARLAYPKTFTVTPPER